MKVEGPISHIHGFILSISATASLNLAVTVEPLPGIESSTSTASTRLFAALQPLAEASENVEGNRNLEAGKVQFGGGGQVWANHFLLKTSVFMQKKWISEVFLVN